MTSLNDTNPIVDRIMDDDFVETLIFANSDGMPLFTNTTLVQATLLGTKMNHLGSIVRTCIKELDVFDEALIVRVSTKKVDILMAPHQEFNIVIGLRKNMQVKNPKNTGQK
ncbi:uncharacterized protein LOC126376828 [Pectinophora gossypiella]|uniref:uncharacterized protein LOC126376828 n=1 Tax=Pectinophora gossypiella TaxID=13191 RepID=UPI00214E47D7|nr:uncharacterized protein LOC126376828 [Pectinophora gossypiella]